MKWLTSMCFLNTIRDAAMLKSRSDRGQASAKPFKAPCRKNPPIHARRVVSAGGRFAFLNRDDWI